ncbi:MAG: MFS transporter [Actinobacteria bacterium]|nr:MFS transporter [Actinomycetota bacterium]
MGDPRRWRALAVLALVQFMIAIDNTVVNVALPSVQRSLGMSPTGLAWVVNGYLLAAGGLLLLGGRVADLVGRRRIFLIGTAVFALASLTAGTAQSGGALIASRFGQGIGEALAAPAALSLVPILFADQKERIKALGIWGAIAGLGAMVGVLLSGVLVDFVGWRAIFLLNLPIAVIPLVLVPRLTNENRSPEVGRSLDLPGAVLVTAGVGGVVYGLLNATGHAWSSLSVTGPLVAGLILLALFVSVESRSRSPLVPMRFFANRTRVSANLCTVIVAGTMMSMFFLIVLYVQQGLGFSPLQSGLAYIPFMVAFAPGIGLSTNLLPRLGSRVIIVVGFLVAAGGMLLFSQVPANGSYLADVLPGMVVLGFGLGLVNPALQNAALHEVSDTDAGLASGIQTTVMQAGSALGLAALVTISLRHSATAVATGMAPHAAAAAGDRLAFLIAAFALAAGAVLAAVLFQSPARGAGATAGPVPAAAVPAEAPQPGG